MLASQTLSKMTPTEAKLFEAQTKAEELITLLEEISNQDNMDWRKVQDIKDNAQDILDSINELI